ncbi:hypothetical protein ACIA8G_04655 [Lentzea sp. NPDC051213]|uniref:hypothetical protein n=1 Tax=Lentzea sp. NPDC051213 TaxID=3364126 RepID=UPI0037948F8F
MTEVFPGELGTPLGVVRTPLVVVSVGTCRDGPGTTGVLGVPGRKMSARAATPAVATALPTTAAVRRRLRTARPRMITSAAELEFGGATSPPSTEKVVRRVSS